MNNKVIAFQGEPGAYSEAAAFEYFGSKISTLPLESFEDVFESVSNASTVLGLIPIENSLAGSIHQNYDFLLQWNLSIIGEYFHRVSHCLMALPGVPLNEIKNIYSHPQALAQSRNNLKILGLTAIARGDTAGSAKWVKEEKNKSSAALASERAAKVYGLDILKTELEDNSANYTRFLILSKDSLGFEENNQTQYKSSLAFSVENKPGALYKALQVFAEYEVDLTKIESRPIAGKPWEYMFYIDFIGHTQSEHCKQSLVHLGEYASYVKVLGSYPRHQITY